MPSCTSSLIDFLRHNLEKDKKGLGPYSVAGLRVFVNGRNKYGRYYTNEESTFPEKGETGNLTRNI